MSAYHTKESFDARQAARRENPRPPLPLKVFHHIACMNNWHAVVTEQWRLLKHVGLEEVTCCILGTPADVEWCEAMAKRIGVKLSVAFVKHDLGLYEGPTIQRLWEWARDNEGGSVLYFHTKGVSVPSHTHKARWRRVMQKYVIADWKQNLEELATHDVLGVSWQTLRDYPHFSGNFWMARCDWLSHLQSPDQYRRRHPGMQWGGYDWSSRMYVETWIGSAPWHHVKTHCGHNRLLWDGLQVFTIPVDVEGFKYVDEAFDYSTCRYLFVDVGGGKESKLGDYLNVDREAAPGWGFRRDLERLSSDGPERLPFADDSVYRLNSAHCFEHIKNLHGLLHEIARVCMVGAEVTITVPHWLSPMAMCHDHKQVIPPEQVDHWCNSAIEYWWKGSKKRFKHLGTEMIPSGNFEECRQLYHWVPNEQIMRYVPGASHEVKYSLQVISHEG